MNEPSASETPVVRSLFFDHALLLDRWHSGVVLLLDERGIIVAISSNHDWDQASVATTFH